MGNLVDHPNRPSVALARYRGELHAHARAAEASGASAQPAMLRAVAHRVLEIGLASEAVYETNVSALICAALDVLEGGGFAGTLDQALDELRRTVNNLRTGTDRAPAREAVAP